MRTSKKVNIALWIVQSLLALFFAVASGAPKLLLPPEMIPMPIVLPHWFLLFIGTAEVLGALGLILPGVLRTRPGLTVAAAAGLELLPRCAPVYHLAAGSVANAGFAMIVCLTCAAVVYGRTRLAPTRSY